MQMTNSIEIGNMQWIPNYALSFDGVDDYVDCGNPGNYDVFTVEFKFKPAQTLDNDLTGRLGLVQKDNGTGGFFVTLFPEDSGRMRFGTNNGNIKTTQDVWQSNSWYHIAVVQETNSQAYIYVDGLQDASGDNGYMGYDDVAMNIGSRVSGDQYFDGKINEVRYWNTARTQQQIQDNMNKELTGNEEGLVAYYKMNKGSGNTLVDYAGNNDGTIIGATWQEVE